MSEGIFPNWKMIALRGALAILFGVLAMVWPGPTLFALVILWGAYALVDGATMLAAAFRGKPGDSRWLLAALGVLGIVAGLVAFIFVGMTALVLLMFIAFWAMAIGVVEIITAVRFRKEVDNAWLLGLTGALAVVLGLFLLFQPGRGAVALVWAIGLMAIFRGVTLVGLAFRLRGSEQSSGSAQASGGAHAASRRTPPTPPTAPAAGATG